VRERLAAQTAANSHRHSNQPGPQQLHREVERLLRENQELRHKVAEREEQIADADKAALGIEQALKALTESPLAIAIHV
jgi:hypothetical protein